MRSFAYRAVYSIVRCTTIIVALQKTGRKIPSRQNHDRFQAQYCTTGNIISRIRQDGCVNVTHP